MKIFKFKNILLILLIIYLMAVFFSQQVIIKRVTAQIGGQKKNYQKIKDENEKLQDEIKLSKTNKYFEKLAREKLGFIKEGETPVIDSEKNK